MGAYTFQLHIRARPDELESIHQKQSKQSEGIGGYFIIARTMTNKVGSSISGEIQNAFKRDQSSGIQYLIQQSVPDTIYGGRV